MSECILYLEGALLSTVEEHEYGHLEGGHLQYVLPCVRTRYLRSSNTQLRPILLQRHTDTIIITN